MTVSALLLVGFALLVGIVVGVLSARGRSAALAAERDGFRQERDTLRADKAQAEERFTTAAAEAAALRARQEEHERSRAEQERALQQAVEALRQSFQVLAADALRHNNQQLVTLAEQQFRTLTTQASGDLQRRQEAITSVVRPLHDTLAKVESQLQSVEKERVSAFAAISEQVQLVRQSSEQVRNQTAALVTALRKPEVRGQWGEMQLRRAAEVAGMLEHCDFDEQVTVAGPDGLQRLDMVVRLAGGKHVVVDAKVPLSAYLEAAEATDDAQREELLRAHARQLRTHVDGLAAKTYWERLPATPDFVVLFVPGEAFLAPALQHQPDLQEYAASRHVLLTTPTTLIALLRTVGFAWRQQRLADNAREVYELGRDLYARLATMGGHVSKLGNALNTAVGTYNKTLASLEGRVLVTARRLVDLNVAAGELDSPSQIEAVAHSVQAAELVASASDTLVALPDLDRLGPLAAPAVPPQASEARHSGG